MIPIHDDLLLRLQKMRVLFWRARIKFRLGLYSKLRKVNIELDLYQGLIQTKNNNNPHYKDSEAKQGSAESYQASTHSITNCNESKWNFADSWGC